jgi:hypothetical protein
MRCMGTLKEYDPEALVEAITGLDWNTDHPRYAMKAIQATILKTTGDDLSEVDAIKLLGRLVERRHIRTQIDPPVLNVAETGWAGPARKAKYSRVPENER